MKRFLPLFIIFILFMPGYVSAKTASGNIIMEFDLSHHQAGKEVKLWIPYPVSDQYQLITDIKVEGDFAESAVYTDQENKTPILYARWNKGTDSRHLTLFFHAIRKEVKKGIDIEKLGESTRIIQGYLSSVQERTVRVRIKGETLDRISIPLGSGFLCIRLLVFANAVPPILELKALRKTHS